MSISVESKGHGKFIHDFKNVVVIDANAIIILKEESSNGLSRSRHVDRNIIISSTITLNHQLIYFRFEL